MKLLSVLGIVGTATATVLAGGLTAPVSAASAPVVVVSGLNNPHALDFAADGALLIAEAGRGGNTAAVTELRGSTKRRIVSGLPSSAGPDGTFATGAAGASRATRAGSTYVVMSGAEPAEDQPAGSPPPSPLSGKLLSVNSRGTVSIAADVSAIERETNPDGTDINPNPYDVLDVRTHQIVVDAGGNTVLEVRGGRVRVLAVLPDVAPGAQAVPTSIALGPDGNYYVGTLGGDAAPPGSAKVYRVTPGGRVSTFATGFDTISGVAFGPDGSLWVTEMLATGFAQFDRFDLRGSLHRIRPNGQRSEVARGQLLVPGGVAVNGAGQVFVSVNSLAPSEGAFGGALPGGRVVRITP